FDRRLLQLLATQSSPAVLVDSAVPSKLQPLVAQAPNAPGAKSCGAALLQRDWVSTQGGPLEKAINNGLEQNAIAAVDVTSQLSRGILLALIIGILDGLDGKQARIKVETSKTGKIEHWFDSFFEVVWPTALAYHFYVSGQLPNAFFYLALLIVAEALDGIGKLGVYVAAEKSLVGPGLFDRIVRLVGGRCIIYVWVLVACVLF